ncbi:hypothetical protein CR513_57012, partial [Mucuna pruriens]
MTKQGNKLRLEAYENSRIYKQKVKRFHDQQILRKEFQAGQKLLMFNSCLKLIAVELKDERTNSTFQVNGHQIKLFHEGPTPLAGVEGEASQSLVIPVTWDVKMNLVDLNPPSQSRPRRVVPARPIRSKTSRPYVQPNSKSQLSCHVIQWRSLQRKLRKDTNSISIGIHLIALVSTFTVVHGVESDSVASVCAWPITCRIRLYRVHIGPVSTESTSPPRQE